ncbi:MAG: sulfatase activating formylglycine-generating enzyme [Myxococcota bacterium]|jgi:formylglycine-generating enzyme required for sulfatase activity
MFCGSCGAENPTTNRFCFECGARLFIPGVQEAGEPLVDDVSARLLGLGSLPEPTIDWPEDLPREVKGADGMRLLLVPGGFFYMGSKKRAAGHVTKKDEQPRRLVWVDSYYIDETPITNELYGAYLEKTGRKRPPGFKASGPGWARSPVSQITWDEARAYARWAERRLPTEAEWEKAARGIDGRIWPWGDDEPTSAHAAFAESGGETAPVSERAAGVSPFGALDMAGNVFEWCADEYDQFFYPRSPPRNPVCTDGDPRYRVLRGGGATYSAFVIRASFRGWNLPHKRSSVYGFRCAADAARYRKRSGTKRA